MIKKIFGLILICMFMLQVGTIAAENPDYKKYGRIAITVVQADYPEDEVTDYEYKGRVKTADGFVEDFFEFLVDEKGKEFNVTVKIKHNPKDNKFLNMTVEEKELKG